MGGCIHNPGSFSDMMEDHKSKGFSDRMDQEMVDKSGKKLRTPGWAELGVVAGVFVLLGILWFCGVFR